MVRFSVEEMECGSVREVSDCVPRVSMLSTSCFALWLSL